MSKGFDKVNSAVARMRTLVAVAKSLDNIEMQLVLDSEVLKAMSCAHGATVAAVSRYRNTLWWQLDSELQRIVSALAILQASRDVPDRLGLAQSQWLGAAGNVEDIVLQVRKLEDRDTGWSGFAREQKRRAVGRQLVATAALAETLDGLGEVATTGQLLMESVFATAAVQVMGNNAQLSGFVHRAPSASVGVWGLFSRSNAALSRVRNTANFLAVHVSGGAPWRASSSQLRRRVNQLAAGSPELPESGWPSPVAGG